MLTLKFHESSLGTEANRPGDWATDGSKNLLTFTVIIYLYSIPARGRPFYYVFMIVRFTKYCKNQGKMAGAPPHRIGRTSTGCLTRPSEPLQMRSVWGKTRERGARTHPPTAPHSHKRNRQNPSSVNTVWGMTI